MTTEENEIDCKRMRKIENWMKPFFKANQKAIVLDGATGTT